MGSLLAVVPRARVHVITFEELAQRPHDVWTALTGFLEIPREPLPEFAVHNRSQSVYRSPTIRRLTHRPPGWLDTPIRKLQQFSRTTDSPLITYVKRRMWRPESRPQVSDELRQIVREHFRDDVELLGRLLDLDLSGWQQPDAERA